ncbi:protein of unknown function [Pseudomonas mediterranea]
MPASSASDTNPYGSRACPRWRQYSQHTRQLTHRYREQARSHSGSWCLLALCLAQIPCGSEPCSRWRQHSQHPGKQTHRFREQARSHIYGYPLFCNTVFDACLACFHLSGVWVGNCVPRALMRIRCPTILIS